MGMAASQARYLALVARKSNCEYEGQQINQSRLSLSNQSADLFNQMMGLQVPTSPSKSDYTYTVYSFTDGDNTYTMDKWNHLADESDGYNYSVTYHYDIDENVGFQKYKRNPQIQYSGAMPTTTTVPSEEVTKILHDLDDMNAKKATAQLLETAYNTAKQLAGKKSTYEDKQTITAAKWDGDPTDTTYNIKSGDNTYAYTNYTALSEGNKEALKTYLDKLVEYRAFKLEDLGKVDDDGKCDYSNVFFNNDTNSIAFAENLAALGKSTTGTTLPIYHISRSAPDGIYTMADMVKKVDDAYKAYVDANNAYELAKTVYEKNSSPALIGNTKLVAIGTADLDEDTSAAITKIIQQMIEDEIPTTLTECFNTLDGTYDATTYVGGLYKFDYTTSTYYTTYYDLYDSAVSGTGVSNIDNQKKLPYYGTQDMETQQTLTSRALIEKDKSGRFTSIRLEDDSLVYTLKAETKTDDIGYEDAMNDYTYQRAVYDKKVQEINAQTSLIQIQDKDLELRLKQLDTEQNALNTEIDAVSKVVKDNVEKSFKTFGG